LTSPDAGGSNALRLSHQTVCARVVQRPRVRTQDRYPSEEQ
jgi:hypothetical protein